MTIWSDLDHRLSVVQRWGTVSTIHKQSVAEHIFNVERIAVRIASAWFGIHEDAARFHIAKWAHHHEDFEALSGDLPTMVKPYLDEAALEAEHSHLIAPQKPEKWVKDIVKLADMLDAYWFLCVERALGNTYLQNHFTHEPVRIIRFVRKTWGDEVTLLKKVSECLDDMTGEESRRHSMRGR